jgi:tetratricopeptide (TPR) repeat protein
MRIAAQHSAWALTLLGFFVLSKHAYAGVSSARISLHLTGFGIAILVLVWGHIALDATSSFGVFKPTADPRYSTLPIVNPNHLAALLLLTIPAGLGLRKQPNRALGLLLFGGALATMAVYSAITGLILALSGALYLHIKKHPRRRLLVVPALLLVIGIFILRSDQDPTESLRLQQLSDVLPMFAEKPLFGVGLGNFATSFEPFRTDTLFRSLSHLHNDPVELLVEVGVIGTGLLFALLLPLLRGIRAHNITLSLVLLGVFSMVEFPLHLPVVSLTVALVLGAAQSERVAQPPTKRWPLVLLLCMALLTTAQQGLTTYAVNETKINWLEQLRSSHPVLLIHRAEQAAQTGDKAGAVKQADQLFLQHGQLAKWAHAAANLYQTLGMNDAAITAMKQAVTRAPANKQHHLGLAALFYSEGRTAEALAATTTGICHDGTVNELTVALKTHPIPLHWLATIETCRPRLLLPLAKLLQDSNPYLALAALDSSPTGHHNLQAQLLARTNQVPRAIALLRGIDLHSVTLRTTLVRILYNDKQYQAAVDAAAPSILSGTASGPMLLLAAKAHYKNNNIEKCAKIINAPENRSKLSSLPGFEVAMLRDTCQRQ